jgi:thiol-disulfide isomerase/thioredoxin
MKKYVILLLIVCFTGCKATKPAAEKTGVENAAPSAVTDYSDQTTWLLGYFSQNQLLREPHSEWYQKGFDEYKPDQEIIKKLHEINKDDISIKIVMGTWCPDSRREVPRFMKVLDEWRFPMEKITFIGVDIDKQSPVGEYEKLEIQRVPTFILYKNNIEAGRIIENPMTSLEQDIVFIIENFKK